MESYSSLHLYFKLGRVKISSPQNHVIMKPEKILESNVLDIIFENRNKAYGAYELRSHYNRRIGKAICFTTMVVVAFALMQSFKVPQKKGRIIDLEIGPQVTLADIPKPKPDEIKPKEVVKVKSANQPEQYKEKQFTIPLIEDNPIVPVASITDLDEAIIGSSNTLEGKNPADVLTAPTSIGNDNMGEAKKIEEDNSNLPISIDEIMPQFPGGQEAFIRFMQKNLRQPDDFDEGQRLTVIAKFIVDAEGNIVDIDIAQNGRKDLDAEVVRVIKKMPRWNPGIQNGRKVSVYFKVPVTFVAPE